MRAAEMTSSMARTDAAAGSRSSSIPGWVDCTVRWTGLVESVGELVLGGIPAGVAEVVGGGQDGERPVVERVERLRLGEHVEDDRQLVTPVPGRARGRGECRDLVGRRRGQVGGRQQVAQTETVQGGQQSEAAAHDGVLAGVSWGSW